MFRRACTITVCLAACLLAQEAIAPTIPQLTKDGDAAYLKGDYEAARLAFTSAWELLQQTPKDNPLRYDILKRLTSVRAAAGDFADADNWLLQAIAAREHLGQKYPKIADDLLVSVSLCRGLKVRPGLSNLQRAAHVGRTHTRHCADDFSRISLRRNRRDSVNSSARTGHPPNWVDR